MEAAGGAMTGLGESVSAMQQGDPGEGTKGPGRYGWAVSHFGHGQVTLPGDLRAHLKPSKVPEGPRPGPEGRIGSQPGRCRQ